MYVYHGDNETGAVQLSPSEIVTCIYRTTPYPPRHVGI